MQSYATMLTAAGTTFLLGVALLFLLPDPIFGGFIILVAIGMAFGGSVMMWRASRRNQ